VTRKMLNATVDGAALAGFVLLVATGLLVRYTLPPGSGGRVPMGGGHGGAQREVGLVLGMTRHEWGDVHFWISVVLLAVLAVHVVLHWKWVASVVRGQPRPEGAGTGARVVVGGVALVALVVVALLPLALEPERVPRSALGDAASVVGEIRGADTFGHAARIAGVPAPVLAQRLGVPADTAPDARLGQLARAHGLTIQDVRRVVGELRREGDTGPR